MSNFENSQLNYAVLEAIVQITRGATGFSENEIRQKQKEILQKKKEFENSLKDQGPTASYSGSQHDGSRLKFKEDYSYNNLY